MQSIATGTMSGLCSRLAMGRLTLAFPSCVSDATTGFGLPRQQNFYLRAL
jgi:hypothetical protein